MWTYFNYVGSGSVISIEHFMLVIIVIRITKAELLSY